MRFLAFEGLDGSGKSTLMTSLKDALGTAGIAHVQTREPGGTALGERIRTLLVGDHDDVPSPRAEALLYQASRAHHVDRLIKPALQRGAWVLSDRFAASSLAFQAGGRDLSRVQIEWLNRFATDDLEPDLYVLLDLTVDESQRRLKGRSERADRFEREAADFHERVRAEYLRLATADPQRWLVVPASLAPAEVMNAVWSNLRERAWLA